MTVSRRIGRIAAPFVLGVLAFVVVEHIARSGDRSDVRSMLDQRIEHFIIADGPLQVAVHSLIEPLSVSTAIRLCRSLANRPVTVHVTHAQTLRTILDDLAAQVGVRVITTTGRPADAVLPTIACPSGPDDYLVIGEQPRAADGVGERIPR